MFVARASALKAEGLQQRDGRRREVRLQLLVRVVDQQLLEAVGGEDLRAKDVQDADSCARADLG